MINVIHASPGVDKSTLSKYLREERQQVAIELNLLHDEFRVLGGVPIDYETEDLIAMELLVTMAAFYLAKGYRQVFLSDFRPDKIDVVLGFLAPHPHRVIRMVIDDEVELQRRVLDESRSSGYRDFTASIAMNRQIRALRYPGEIAINVTGKPVEVIAGEVLAGTGILLP